jgi:hypothetical protein
MQIFVSYSRVDRPFTEQLVARLRRIFPPPKNTVWYDDDLYGGDSWWDAILDQIASSDIFLYVLSNESIESSYCRAELAEAQRLHKRVITLQARDRTKLPPELEAIQFVDMKNGVDNAEALSRLLAAINKQLENIPERAPKPIRPERTPRPITTRPADAPPPRRDISLPEQSSPTGSRAIIYAAIIVFVIIVIGALISIPQLLNGSTTPTPSPTVPASVSIPTTAAVIPTETQEATASVTSSPTSAAISAVIEPSPTNTPDAPATFSIAPDQIGGYAYVFVPQGEGVDAFWIMTYEVTNEAFAAYLNRRGGNMSSEGRPLYAERASGGRLLLNGNTWTVQPGYENHPAARVSWYGARDFCVSIGARLPTGLEWQKAASWNPASTQTTAYPWGDTLTTSDRANFDAADTAPVDSYPVGRSPVGAFHMSGNVAEWVADTRGVNRTRYGGGFTDKAEAIRTNASVTDDNDRFTSASVGFRCAIDRE